MREVGLKGPTLALLLAPASMAAAADPAWLRLTEPQPVENARVAYFEWATRGLEPQFDPKYVLEFHEPRRKASLAEGEWAGDWVFLAKPGERLPRSAWRIRISPSPPYRVTADRYCDGEECERLANELRQLRAPRPEGSEALRADWRRIVAAEACDPLSPVSTRLPPTPPEEARRGITGQVRVKAFHNRCGEVRDVVVETSSGNRNLDRSAIKWVLRWRIQAPKPGWAGWTSQVVPFGKVEMNPPLDGTSVPAHDVQSVGR